MRFVTTVLSLDMANSSSASWQLSLHWSEQGFGVSCHHQSLKQSLSLITIAIPAHSVRLTAQALLPRLINFRASKMITKDLPRGKGHYSLHCAELDFGVSCHHCNFTPFHATHSTSTTKVDQLQSFEDESRATVDLP
jgi:hypothetical protein